LQIIFTVLATALAIAPESSYKVEVHHGHHAPVKHHIGQYHELPIVHQAAGVYAPNHHHEDYYAYPKYKYEYGVKDPHTGDHKSQWEHRDGDKVVGEYTLDEADGTKRVVSYTADDHNGFQAVVKKIGHAHHPQVYGHQAYPGHY